MEQHEMVALIQQAAPHGTWADFGAGSGNFTRALASLLGTDGTIYAIDLHAKPRIETWQPGITVYWQSGDFTRLLTLPSLDGILMANALHFIPPQQQVTVLRQVREYLKPEGKFVLVEYDLKRPLPYVPHPVGWDRFVDIATEAGFTSPTRIGVRQSPSSGISMVAALAVSRS